MGCSWANIDGCVAGIVIPVCLDIDDLNQMNDISENIPEFIEVGFQKFVIAYSSKYPQLEELSKNGLRLHKIIQESPALYEIDHETYLGSLEFVLGQGVDRTLTK